jgi:integrase/recombinase XerD
MTHLRQQMIDLMMVKHLSPRTQTSYLYSVQSLAVFYHRSPDTLTQEDVQQYLIDLVKRRHLAANSCRLQLQGIRFFYLHVLGQSLVVAHLCYPKRELKIPDLLTHSEAQQLVNAPSNLKHQTLLKVCYGCGLRVSELCRLRVKDIDGERQLLLVKGKGNKDRLVPLPATVLKQLRYYWQRYRPTDILFYSERGDFPLSISAAQRLYYRVKKAQGIDKKGGIHGLRHAFATHQLEAGLPIHLLQRWLGHSDIHTTMRYIHWVPTYQCYGNNPMVDLLRGELS